MEDSAICNVTLPDQLHEILVEVFVFIQKLGSWICTDGLAASSYGPEKKNASSYLLQLARPFWLDGCRQNSAARRYEALEKRLGQE